MVWISLVLSSMGLTLTYLVQMSFYRLEALNADYQKAIHNLHLVEDQLARESAAKLQAERALGEAQEHIRLQASGSLHEVSDPLSTCYICF